MLINISSRLAILIICFVRFATICPAFATAFPQDFRFDESGKIIAYTNAERHDLTVLSYPKCEVMFRATIADFFRENSWSPLNSINPIPGVSFSQISLHPEGDFIAFKANAIGHGAYSGIFNVKFRRSNELHFGDAKSFEFSPDGKWLVTNSVFGNVLMPFGAPSGSRPVLPAEPRNGIGLRSFYFSQDCNMIAECAITYVQYPEYTTEINIYRPPAEFEKLVRNSSKIELGLVKQIHYEGSAEDLRLSPDNKWLLWKAARPGVLDVFVSPIDRDDAKNHAIKLVEGKFWGDVCFAGTKSDYCILAQKTGEVEGRDRVSLWKQSMDLQRPAELVFNKPGSCHYPIEINHAGTHALVPIEIRTDITGGHGLYSETEAASLSGSQFFLIELKIMKEVWAFPMNGKFARFHPTRPTVVVRDGDHFSEYDLAGNPVVNDELPTTPESRTKR